MLGACLLLFSFLLVQRSWTVLSSPSQTSIFSLLALFLVFSLLTPLSLYLSSSFLSSPFLSFPPLCSPRSSSSVQPSSSTSASSAPNKPKSASAGPKRSTTECPSSPNPGSPDPLPSLLPPAPVAPLESRLRCRTELAEARRACTVGIWLGGGRLLVLVLERGTTSRMDSLEDKKLRRKWPRSIRLLSLDPLLQSSSPKNVVPESSPSPKTPTPLPLALDLPSLAPSSVGGRESEERCRGRDRALAFMGRVCWPAGGRRVIWG